MTALHWGVEEDRESLIRLLLDNNADTNIGDKKVTPGTRARGWCMVWIWCVVEVVVVGEDGVSDGCSKGVSMGITGEDEGEGWGLA